METAAAALSVVNLFLLSISGLLFVGVINKLAQVERISAENKKLALRMLLLHRKGRS